MNIDKKRLHILKPLNVNATLVGIPRESQYSHLVTEEFRLNQSNNGNHLGYPSEAPQNRKNSTGRGSDGPPALPGIRTTLSGLVIHLQKQKVLGSNSPPSSKIPCFYIQDVVHIFFFINRKTKLKQRKQNKNFYLKKLEKLNMTLFSREFLSHSHYFSPIPIIIEKYKNSFKD